MGEGNSPIYYVYLLWIRALINLYFSQEKSLSVYLHTWNSKWISWINSIKIENKQKKSKKLKKNHLSFYTFFYLNLFSTEILYEILMVFFSTHLLNITYMYFWRYFFVYMCNVKYEFIWYIFIINLYMYAYILPGDKSLEWSLGPILSLNLNSDLGRGKF